MGVNCCGKNSTKWGASPRAVQYAYKGIIRAGLNYNSLAWASACRFKGVMAELRKLQRLALKCMGPMRHSTPTRGLELLTHTRPLELEIRKSAAEAALRTREHAIYPFNDIYSNIDARKGHRQWSEEFLYGIGCQYADSQFDEGHRTRFWTTKFIIDEANHLTI